MLTPCDPKSCPGCPGRAPSLLDGLTVDEFGLLQSIRRPMSFEKGATLPLSVSGLEGMHMIRKGSMKLLCGGGRGRAIQLHGPGHLLIAAEPVRAEAISDMTTCFFPFSEFRRMCGRAPRLAENFVQLFYGLLTRSRRGTHTLSHTTVRQRVGMTLNALADEFGRPSEYGRKIDVAVDRSTLSELSATTAESFSRILKEFEDEGLVYREGWTIHIIQPLKP